MKKKLLSLIAIFTIFISFIQPAFALESKATPGTDIAFTKEHTTSNGQTIKVRILCRKTTISNGAEYFVEFSENSGNSSVTSSVGGTATIVGDGSSGVASSSSSDTLIVTVIVRCVSSSGKSTLETITFTIVNTSLVS